MVSANEVDHHIPGYTGFLPGGQHQMAKTYGQASSAALDERQANDDPLKWRKHVSYAEFTPAHTPAEEHHIPGYGGHVPGIYSENLYAKTYGKTTLQAVEGKFPKGVMQVPDEQYKSSNKLHMGDTAGHPGKPQDIMSGGVSWAGASPYNLVGEDADKPMQPTAPWPPSTVQIAGGKEPAQPSPLLKNFPPATETTEPALYVTSKGDPHDPMDPVKKTMTQTPGNYQIPGYSGFVPGVQSENLYAGTYASITAGADTIRDPKVDDEANLRVENIAGASGVLPLHAAEPPRLRTAELNSTAVDGPAPLAKHLPGYTGFVPGVQSENIYSKTYGHATNIAISGQHKRFQWREQENSERFRASSQVELVNFGHPAKIQDAHITYAHDHNNPALARHHLPEPVSVGNQIPGYGGFIPGVQSRNMFGQTQFETSTDALSTFKSERTTTPSTAPPATDGKDQLGMLQFKPNGFLYQKRMQGEWNNGMLGSRNYSAVKLAEGNIWKGDLLYKPTSAEMHRGHKNCDVPKVFSMGPAPTFENMDYAKQHKSLYLGYYAL